MAGAFSNVVLTFPDQNLRTKVIVNPALPIAGSAAIFGSQSPQTLTHKTITDATNNVAANALRNGTNIVNLGNLAPVTGQVLSAVNANTLTWTNPVTSFVGNVIYVNLTGSNVTGNGSVNAPFQTVAHAMSTIVSTGPTDLYTIIVGPGWYADGFSLKANVTVAGTALQTYLTGNIDINDASWLDPAGLIQNQSAFINCILIGTLTFDYNAQQSSAGSINFVQAVLVNVPTFTGFAGNNQNRFIVAIVINGVISSGCTDIWEAPTFFGGTYSMISNANGNTSAIMYGGGGGGMSIVHTAANPHTVSATLNGFAVSGSLTVDGASASASVTADCLLTPPTILAGGTVTLLTTAQFVSYTPAVPGDWTVQPTTIAQALDMIAAKITPV